jgi:hypothetical protein
MKGGKRQTIKIKIGGGEMVTKYGVSSELRTFVASVSQWGGAGSRRTGSRVRTVTLLWARRAGLGACCMGYHMGWW